MSKKASLEVMIEDGKLVISIGLSTISKTVAYNLNNDNYLDGTITVTDEDEFASALAEQIRSDEEEGASPLQELFDAAAIRALENGAAGIELSSEEESEAGEDYAEN